MFRISLLVAFLATTTAHADVKSDIAELAKPGSDPKLTRAAWDRVVQSEPSSLLPLLKAWPTEDAVAANWLRTAFDQIAKAHSQKLPLAELLAYASDVKAPGKARRVALGTVETAKPGTTAKLFATWLNDPEFGPDAVADRISAIDALTDAGEQTQQLRALFSAATNLEQSLLIAKRLTSAGEKANVFAQLGIVPLWHAVGPFPVSAEEGLAKALPPEAKLDLSATYDGKNAKLAWKPVHADAADGKLDVVKFGMKPEDGSVTYATATITLAAPAKAELRAAAVDNLTVWVNGKKVTERASEYRSMFRPDRYRGTIELPKGESVILIKLTKTPAEVTAGKPGAVPKWDFLVRFVDADGRAIPFTQAGEKK